MIAFLRFARVFFAALVVIYAALTVYFFSTEGSGKGLQVLAFVGIFLAIAALAHYELRRQRRIAATGPVEPKPKKPGAWKRRV